MAGSDVQRAEALERAQEVRQARARLKRQMKAGTVDAREVLTDPPPIIHTMKARDFLRAVPKVGRIKADKITRKTDTDSTPVGRMSPSTRQRITDLLP